MSFRVLPGAALVGSICLVSCASPYFVHDPRTLVVDRQEVPRLLKSIRCELATFIAANNQRNILFVAESKVRGVDSAAEKYQYYEIDPRRFGNVTLSLIIQDTLGLQSGTQFDRYKTTDFGVHAHFLDLGPTGSDQSTYAATWNFVIPQDAITLRTRSSNVAAASQGDFQEAKFSCFSKIPKKAVPPFASIYAEDDLDALARNDFPDYALFRRVLVNNTTPLAAWLQDVGSSITNTTLHWHDVQQKPEEMIPAQMVYQFSVQVTGGLDVKYGLTSPLWPTAAVEVAGSMQKTNTISITLNGIESFDWFASLQGGALNDGYAPLPTIKVNGSPQPLPGYVGRKKPRGRPEWPVDLKPAVPSIQR